MFMSLPFTQGRLGLRTLKTGLAVALSVWVTWLLGSQYPIFAVVAVIYAMSRTINGTLETCREQLIGTAFGALTGCVFLYLFPDHALAFMGLGVIVVILLCNRMRVPIAIPLSCVVFCVICLNSPGTNNIAYSFYRFVDTLTGLLIAFAVNALILPYNNLPEIQKLMRSLQKEIPVYAWENILAYQFPDLQPLNRSLNTLNHELDIYEKERFQRKKRQADAAYLRGCQQLLTKMSEELFSICHLDSTPVATPENLQALGALGLEIPEDYHPDGKCSPEDHVVLNFHLRNMLDCHRYLTELLDSPDFPELPPAPWAPLENFLRRRFQLFKIRMFRIAIRGVFPRKKQNQTKKK
jgi:uncharacterized membrane protein YgaE (UPF0421/DUF939 family)